MLTKTSLNKKTALITGASSGIGLATAKRLAAEGCSLILAARRIEQLKEIAHELQTEFHCQVHCVELDVTQVKQVEEAFTSLPEAFKNIDILVNNAGLAAGLDPLQNGDPNDWDKMIDTNVKGLLYVTRQVLPLMLARNTGHIINLGSVAGHTVYPNGNVYCATKFAVNALTQGLRMDLFGSAIRVTTIDPGMVETDFSKIRFKGDEERANAVYRGLQALTPADIADTIYYVLTCPAHVNICEIILTPTAQVSAQMVHRN